MKHLSEFFYSPAVFRKEISILRSFWLQVYLELIPTQMAAVSFNLGVRDVQWKWWSGEFSISPDEETQSRVTKVRVRDVVSDFFLTTHLVI